MLAVPTRLIRLKNMGPSLRSPATLHSINIVPVKNQATKDVTDQRRLFTQQGLETGEYQKAAEDAQDVRNVKKKINPKTGTTYGEEAILNDINQGSLNRAVVNQRLQQGAIEFKTAQQKDAYDQAVRGFQRGYRS